MGSERQRLTWSTIPRCRRWPQTCWPPPPACHGSDNVCVGWRGQPWCIGRRGLPCAGVQQLATPLRAGLERRVDAPGASLERRLAPPLARLQPRMVLTAWGRKGGGAASYLARQGTQTTFMPKNSSSCSPDAMEGVEKMVRGGHGERRCGAVLARRMASFK